MPYLQQIDNDEIASESNTLAYLSQQDSEYELIVFQQWKSTLLHNNEPTQGTTKKVNIR